MSNKWMGEHVYAWKWRMNENVREEGDRRNERERESLKTRELNDACMFIIYSCNTHRHNHNHNTHTVNWSGRALSLSLTNICMLQAIYYNTMNLCVYLLVVARNV